MSNVDIVTINDNPPQIVIRGGMECITEMSRRGRRDAQEEKGPEERMKRVGQKQQVPIDCIYLY